MTRQVLVDRKVLERVLPAKWPGAEVCRICCVRLSPGEKHLSDCPVPALQAALTQPPAEPERALGLLADYIEAEQDEPADMPAGVESATLEDARHALLTLDPAHLRALAAQPERALVAELENLAADWERYSRDKGCHEQWRDCRAACAAELRNALAQPAPEQEPQPHP